MAYLKDIVPTADSIANVLESDVVGNKQDAANITADEASLVGLLRWIVANINTDADVLALLGALNTAGHAGAVDDATTIMGYVKQLVTDLIATLADTNELQTDWTNGGRLDLLIDGIIAKLAKPTADLADDDTISQVVGIKADTASGTSLVALAKQILVRLTKPVKDAVNDSTPADVLGLKEDDAVITVALTKSVIAYLKGLINLQTGVTAIPAAAKREAGRTQYFTKAVTTATTNGTADITLATVTDNPCKIKSIVLRQNGAVVAELTSLSIFGGASKVVTFIDAVTGLAANLSAADTQVSWNGDVLLNATKTIVLTIVGTGISVAQDLTVGIEYIATVDGGYLV